MKHTLFIRLFSLALMMLLLLGTILACGEKPAPAPNPDPEEEEEEVVETTEKLKVMTFNIRVKTNEASLDRDWTYTRRYSVAKHINNSGADVVCLQEVKKDQFSFIQANTSYKYNCIFFTGNEGVSADLAGQAILYRKGLELLSSEKFWLSETPDEVSLGWGATHYRICANATLKTEKGTIFTVSNNHLDHQVAEARNNGIALVLERLTFEYPTIVCGDFNTHKSSSVYALMSEKMQDAQLIADVTDTGITYHNWGALLEESNPIYDIDFMFVSNGTKVHTYDILQETDDKGRYISDHFAVTTEISLQIPEVTP